MKFTLGFILLFAGCIIFVGGAPIYDQTPQADHEENHHDQTPQVDHEENHQVQEKENHELDTATPSPSPLNEEEGDLVRKALLRYFRAINDALSEYTKRIATEAEIHYPERNEVHPHAR